MVVKSYITCTECGTKNQDSDYCIQCGALINVVLKRRMESEQKIEKRKQIEAYKTPDKLTKIIERGLEHPNSFVRWASNAIYSLWTFLALVLGALIAAVIAAAAG